MESAELRDMGLKREFVLKWVFFEFFFLFMYVIQHVFICRPSDSTVSEDAGIEPRTVAPLALPANALTTQLDLNHSQLDLIHT
jgi:hypothetical protein